MLISKQIVYLNIFICTEIIFCLHASNPHFPVIYANLRVASLVRLAYSARKLRMIDDFVGNWLRVDNTLRILRAYNLIKLDLD